MAVPGRCESVTVPGRYETVPGRDESVAVCEGGALGQAAGVVVDRVDALGASSAGLGRGRR